MECMDNWNNSIKQTEKNLIALTAKLEKDRKDYAFYVEQIQRALTEKRTAFDSYKYGVKRLDRQA